MAIFNDNDLARARQRVKDNPWSAEILAAVRARADAWLAHPADMPTLSGGWAHDYVCPEHWCALAFDFASPHAHRCPCGDTHSNEKADAAWRAIAHWRTVDAARDLALVFALTDEHVYADAATAILEQYALNYSNYAGADAAPAWMRKGRAFYQALAEAIWTIPIAQTYDLIRATLTPEQETLIVNSLLRPIVGTLTTAQDELIQQQEKLKSHTNAWLIAALGLLGYALRDEMLVERALDNQVGFRAHLAAAILPDGFEYEATPYYHNFVALAYTMLAEAARANDRDIYVIHGPNGQSIEMMWSAFSSLAFADGSIPQLNDGAYWLNSAFATEICETYEVALARTEDAEFAWLLKQTYRGNPRDTWSALLFAERDLADAPMPARKSVCLQSVGLAVLRDQTNAQEVCVPFGAHAGSHSHLDRAAVQIFPWSTDAGAPPHGVDARAVWYQQTAAHNMVVVDDQSQTACQAQLLNWEITPDTTILWLSADDAYPGVRLTRLVTLVNGIVKDFLLIDSEVEHTYDWIIHVDGECHVEDLAMEEVVGELADTGAYRFVMPYARRHCAGKFQVTLTRAEKIFLLTLTADAPLELILARTPARVDAPTHRRQTIIARARKRRVNFVATSQMIDR